MKRYLAQVNIAELKAPIDHPSIATFVGNLDHINGIAEQSPGFIWRLKDEDNNATSFNPYNNELIIINCSIWADLTSLKNFVYHTEHIKFFKRRNEWFVPMTNPHMTLWWTKDGLFPDAEECKKRLDHLWEHGPSEYSFDFLSIPDFS